MQGLVFLPASFPPLTLAVSSRPLKGPCGVSQALFRARGSPQHREVERGEVTWSGLSLTGRSQVTVLSLSAPPDKVLIQASLKPCSAFQAEASQANVDVLLHVIGQEARPDPKFRKQTTAGPLFSAPNAKNWFSMQRSPPGPSRSLQVPHTTQKLGAIPAPKRHLTQTRNFPRNGCQELHEGHIHHGPVGHSERDCLRLQHQPRPGLSLGNHHLWDRGHI